MASVEFKQAGKTYSDGSEALKDLSLSAEDGELLVLVGPSGCGKSTALRLLAGLEELTQGDILIGGKSVRHKSPQQRNIAMVFQNYALYPHMTVYGNLVFPLRMAGQRGPSLDRQVRVVAETLGLTALLDKKPAALSGGQRQRVAMGRAMVREPKVFLLDEPLSNLDTILRSQVRAEIAALQRRLGTTMLYVTHDQAEAMTLGNRIAVLNHGELQQAGTPQALYDQPASLFVAGFLGSPPMNLFATVARKAGNTPAIELGTALLPVPSRLQAALVKYIDAPLFAGLRPEAFTLSGDSDRKDNTLDLEVIAEEHLGHERLLYVAVPCSCIDDSGKTLEPSQFVVRLSDGPGLQPGDRVILNIDTRRLHLFTLQGDALPVHPAA